MEFIIRALLGIVFVPLASLFAFWLVGKIGKRNLRLSKNTDDYDFVVAAPAWASWLCLLLALLLIAVLFLVYNPDNPTMIYGIILFAVMAGIMLLIAIIARYNKMVVLLDTIKIYSAFKRVKVIGIDEITAIRKISNNAGMAMVFYADDKKLFTGGFQMLNMNVLIKRILDKGRARVAEQ